MPLQDGLLIGVKNGVVELTANLVEPHRDEPSGFGEALHERLAEHQHQAMSDEAIMGEELGLASCIVCRDPVPDPLKASLASTGFSPEETPTTGPRPRSLFGRLGGTKQRARLEKWAIRYARCKDLHDTLAAFEATIVEQLEPGSLTETADEGADLVLRAGRFHLGLPLESNFESLQTLERHIDRIRRSRGARWVLHPLAVRAMAAYTAQCIASSAHFTSWSEDPDDDNPLWVQVQGGLRVATDPEYRVIEFVRRGLRAALSDYVVEVVRQSQRR